MADTPTDVILLSGGPDSASMASMLASDGERVLRALYLQCGHATDAQELAAADLVASSLSIPMEILDVSHLVAGLGGQRLLIHSEASILPFGNLIALSIAFAYAKRIGAQSVAIALHADDAAESVEYTEQYLRRFETAANVGWSEPKIDLPLISLTKPEVLSLGHKAGARLCDTWSCIRPGDIHCGYCGACRARARGFADAGIEDTTRYGVTNPVALASVGPR